MMDWIPIILIFSLLLWIAKYNSTAWFFIGFMLLLLGAIALPPPWKDIAQYAFWGIMAVWVVGALFGSGSTGGNDRGGFRDDEGGG